jgi:zinc transport system substrate-binding protein
MSSRYRSRVLSVLSCTLALLLDQGCAEPQRAGQTAARREDSKLTVYVVNYPLRYFAERIGGELVRVEFPVPPDVDPAYWAPAADLVSDYQRADLILLNGAGYASWVDKVTLPASRLVNTSGGLEDRYIALGGVVTHSHGPEGEHAHGDVAFTTWLDPALAVEQARAIQRAFAAARPDDAPAFQEGFALLERDLVDLDERLVGLLAGMSEHPLLASHSVYQYFARRYELDLESVHFEPDEFPDDRGWRELEGLLRDHPAEWMLWEAQPMAESAGRLKELAIESVVFAPCANTPSEGDFLSVMRENVRNLEEAFGG